jgi:predicted O-methyltransferase YrrM
VSPTASGARLSHNAGVDQQSVPSLVLEAQATARTRGFSQSCAREVGDLLRLLAATKPGGSVAESGTGTGVGAAWLLSGMDAAARLVTVEREAALATVAADLLAADTRARVLAGDWRLLIDEAPFDLFFCDGGGKRDAVDDVVALLAPGGILVLDDFEPAASWPPLYRGELDTLRLAYLEHPALFAREVRVSDTMACVVAVRRP